MQRRRDPKTGRFAKLRPRKGRPKPLIVKPVRIQELDPRGWAAGRLLLATTDESVREADLALCRIVMATAMVTIHNRYARDGVVATRQTVSDVLDGLLGGGTWRALVEPIYNHISRAAVFGPPEENDDKKPHR